VYACMYVCGDVFLCLSVVHFLVAVYLLHVFCLWLVLLSDVGWVWFASSFQVPLLALGFSLRKQNLHEFHAATLAMLQGMCVRV
jgi:hypothetical protein